MESIKGIIKRAAPGTSLPTLSKPSSEALKVNENGETYLSLYTGDLTPKVVTESMAELKASFPALPAEFFTMLSKRVKDNGFSDERLRDAVRHVIDNCIYPNPTIAQFIGFDKKVRLFTYHEMLEKVNNSGGDSSVWSYYETMSINGKMFWFSKVEI